jgi:predicted Fe-Mo cluster-binding NifX family protein
MKIAAVTDDGITISPHFGRASQYAVLTVENGQIVSRELRDKLGHSQFAGEEDVHDPSQPHGFGPEAQDRHSRMIGAIQDCQVLLARGMGWGARRSLEEAGIQTLITDVENIDTAVQGYVAGQLVDHTELLH